MSSFLLPKEPSYGLFLCIPKAHFRFGAVLECWMIGARWDRVETHHWVMELWILVSFFYGLVTFTFQSPPSLLLPEYNPDLEFYSPGRAEWKTGYLPWNQKICLLKVHYSTIYSQEGYSTITNFGNFLSFQNLFCILVVILPRPLLRS